MGSTAIAHHPADQTIARLIAARLEAEGEETRLLTASDQVNQLERCDRSIILWSPQSVNSVKFDDMWRLLDRRQHALFGDVLPDALPRRVPRGRLLVVGDNGTLTPKEPVGAVDLDTSNRKDALRTSNYTFYAWLAVYAMSPIVALSLMLLGYTREVSIGQAVSSSIAHGLLGTILLFVWFMALAGFSSVDIGSSWPDHKLATYRMIGGIIGLCIPQALHVYVIAADSLEAGDGGRGLGIAALALFVFLVAPIFGLVGILGGWLCGWLVDRYQTQRDQSAK